MTRKRILLLILVILLVLLPFRPRIQRYVLSGYQYLKGKNTVESVLEQYASSVRVRMKPSFKKNFIDYPPTELIFVGIKSENLLEIWASGKDGKFKK